MKQKKKEGKKEIKKGNQNTQQLGRSGSKRTLNQKSACLFSFGWSMSKTHFLSTSYE